MKNSTCIALLCLLMSTMTSFGANHQKNHVSKNNLRISGSGHANVVNSFTPFFTEDFSGGIPGGWQNVDSSGSGLDWKATSTGASDHDSLSTTGTTASNGYVIIDSDSAGNIGFENADLITAPIDCSTKPSVHLNFNEYIKYYNDTATVWVSNDNINWTMVHNSSDGLTQHTGGPNPNNVDIDITAIAANQATVYIRFNYRADFSYYWMIDDIQLYELPAADAAINEVIGPVTSCILLSATESVTVNVFNSGANDMTGGFDVTYIADGGSPVTEHVATTITAGASLPYTFAATVDFSAPGSHNLTAYVVLTGDTNQTNDTISSDIWNGPHPVNTANQYAIGFESNEDLSQWLSEDGNSDATTWDISALFPHSGSLCAQITSPLADDWFFSPCLDLDASLVYKLSYFYRTTSTSTQADYEVLLGNSQSSGDMTQQIVTLGRITNVAYLPSNSTFSVSASGTYYLGWHVMNGDSIASFRLDDILLRVDSGVGINKINENDFSAFPNPSTGKLFLSGLSGTGNLTVEVVNSTGQSIYMKKTSSLDNYEIDLAGQPSGIYMVRIISDKGITVKKISINR